PGQAIRAQYAEGPAGQAYRAEPAVAPDSNAETFAALRLDIDNWRWAGVPFFLRTGKRLAARSSEIAIRFRPAPLAGLRDTTPGSTQANWLVLRLQPKEGMSLQFDARKPGQG